MIVALLVPGTSRSMTEAEAKQALYLLWKGRYRMKWKWPNYYESQRAMLLDYLSRLRGHPANAKRQQKRRRS